MLFCENNFHKNAKFRSLRWCFRPFRFHENCRTIRTNIYISAIKAKYFALPSASNPVKHIFLQKISGKQIFSQKSAKSHVFTLLWQKGLFVSHVANKFYLFIIILGGKVTFVLLKVLPLFSRKCCHFHIFSQAISRKFSFQP